MLFTVTMHELIPRSQQRHPTTPTQCTMNANLHTLCRTRQPFCTITLPALAPAFRIQVPPAFPPGEPMARGSPHWRIWPTPLRHRRGRMIAESVRHNSAPLPPLRAFPPPNSPHVPRLAGRHGLPHEPGASPGSPEEGPVLCFGTHCTSLWWGTRTCTLL